MVKPNDNTTLFDPDARRVARRRAASSFDQYRFLHDMAWGQILDRLGDVRRDFGARHNLSAHDFDNETEALAFEPESLALITSCLNLHAVNDLPGLLVQIRKSLKPDGLFMAAMFGGETLYELRESLMETELTLKGGASPRVFPFADKQQMGGLLQRAGFALPVVDSDIVRVSYEDIFKLMHDLRGMGESNVIAARSRINPGKAFFTRAGQYYQEHFTEKDGRITASFEIIYLIGWAPHESQQQPLKPGSAERRLADALMTREEKAGEPL
ncbi:MAG TPA: SAM-dependent methyltransferase [Alphaproteobacteria bacterium]|nr:SAM-dependent methyltransferase [Alphaproteobacteria bacterium]USO06595.1 MAG: SAM-dependent methyltransferase [Rhodospirillales bacterium]HOO80982.1 SAM-dependent methyltransferase [Alphaproteobacteria bacterium]